MNIVMIHGMNQQGETADTLKARWTDHLNAVSPGLVDPEQVTMPFFGDILYEWAREHRPASQTMGAGQYDTDWLDAFEEEFLAETLDEICRSQGITEENLEQALFGDTYQDAETSIPMNNPATRALTRFWREHEKCLTPLGLCIAEARLNMRQAYIYLKVPAARQEIDALIRPCLLTGEPTVLITHSIGTIVAYLLLRELDREGKTPNVPLLVTLGSPLGLQAIRDEFGKPWRKPASVKLWANFYDPADLLTLGKGLNEAFAGGILDDGTVNNKAFFAHSIEGYLSHKGVAAVLKTVLLPKPVDQGAAAV